MGCVNNKRLVCASGFARVIRTSCRTPKGELKPAVIEILTVVALVLGEKLTASC
jgi:hypothetical protein